MGALTEQIGNARMFYHRSSTKPIIAWKSQDLENQQMHLSLLGMLWAETSFRGAGRNEGWAACGGPRPAEPTAETPGVMSPPRRFGGDSDS